MPKIDEDGDSYAKMSLLIRSFQISKMLEVAASLEIADRIGDGPRPARELARECGADQAMLLRLCRALAAFGIFAVDEAGNIGQTSPSGSLRRDSSPTLHYAVRFWMTPGSWTAWGNLGHVVRTGEPAFKAAMGVPMFEYLKAHPEEARLFDGFMQHSPDDRQAAVVEAYDFSDAGLMRAAG